MNEDALQALATWFYASLVALVEGALELDDEAMDIARMHPLGSA